MVCVGRDVRIGSEAQLRDSIVLDGTVIAEGARVEDAIIGKNVKVGPCSAILNGAVIGDGCKVKAYTRC